MASIERRGNGWRARYRDPDGVRRQRTFPRKAEAQRFLDEVTASTVTGQYVDPRAGRVTFRDYAEQWRADQMHRPSSAAHVETMLRRHAYPTLGDRPIASIKPSTIQGMIKRLPLALSTVHVLHGIVSSIFRAAVRDRLIVDNPCQGTRLPRKVRPTIVPLSVEAVSGVADAVPPQFRALVILCAGTGLRQGEAFGLTVDRVNFLP